MCGEREEKRRKRRREGRSGAREGQDEWSWKGEHVRSEEGRRAGEVKRKEREEG